MKGVFFEFAFKNAGFQQIFLGFCSGDVRVFSSCLQLEELNLNHCKKVTGTFGGLFFKGYILKKYPGLCLLHVGDIRVFEHTLALRVLALYDTAVGGMSFELPFENQIY